MDASELRNFNIQELRGRITQWKEELFRARFKAESSETKDTSIFGKLRRDIARASTVLGEKLKGAELTTAPAMEHSTKPEKPVKKASKAVQSEVEISKAATEPEDKPVSKKSREKVKTDGK
jgi:large subunit ribosomal protein L29